MPLRSEPLGWVFQKLVIVLEEVEMVLVVEAAVAAATGMGLHKQETLTSCFDAYQTYKSLLASSRMRDWYERSEDYRRLELDLDWQLDFCSASRRCFPDDDV